MNTRSLLTSSRFPPLIYIIILFSSLAHSAGLTPVTSEQWNETAIRRVLHTFAYGGFASDAQITAWANLPPQTAINEIFSFAPVNQKLSPVVDNTGVTGTDLESLQAYWSSNQAGNLVCPDERKHFRQTYVHADGNTVLYNPGLQNTWVAMVNTRGLNPFANNIGFWLVNYHMAVNLHDTEPPLITDLYDQALFDLASHQPFHHVLANGASSAAVAREYGHRQNRYNNNTGIFTGNDDFAREFHQLFFRINGTTEDPFYHENTTIEHTAWLLSGTRIDKVTNAYGTTLASEYWVAPINFTDHFDDTGRNLLNLSIHPAIDLEIYHTLISGLTAQDKLYQLSALAGDHPESLANLPVAIITYFADDNLNAEKINAIRGEWQLLAGQPDDFLNFLRAYAISTAFHSIDTFKYRTAFLRNMTLYNLKTLNNDEHYGNSTEPRVTMQLQGAEVFIPKHDVFGGQTSLNAANNPDLFKEAFNKTVNSPNQIIKTREVCHDTNGVQQSVWLKDWGSTIPADVNGQWPVAAVGEWLWQHFIGDGGKNYSTLERAQVTALLATGYDLAYLVDPADPDIVYSSADITSTQAPLVLQNEQTLLDLDNTTTSVRREANRRVGMAVSFISMTPFSFAMQGDLIAIAPEILPAGNRVDMFGRIETVTADYLNISGNKIWIVANTIIKFDGDTSGQFEIGQDVELKAQPNVDGTFTAIKMSVSAGTAPPPTTGNSAPTAMVNGPYSGTATLVVSFSSAGSSDPENDPLTFSWTFGDGTSSTLANPNHTYAIAGSYNVSLTVNDGNGNSHTASTTADILTTPPVSNGKVIELNGVISSVSGNQFVVSGITIYLTSTTKLTFQDSSATTLAVGQTAELKGKLNSDGSVNALEVAVK